MICRAGAKGRALDRLGIDFISVFGMPPVAFVALAADLGCRHISLAPQPITSNPHGYPHWSLLEDAALRRDVAAALRDHDVSVSLGEGFLVRPGVDIADSGAPLFDVMEELGVKRVNVASIEQDQGRGFDQFAVFAGMAAARGMESTLEYAPIMAPGDLPTALAALRHVQRPDFRLLIDAMHFFRGGANVADLAAVDPEQIGYIQLCDAPLAWTLQSYVDEARYERLCPGEGELPLFDLLAALPRHRVVGLEIPMQARALAGFGPKERLAPCIAAARALLARVEDEMSVART